MRAVTVGDFCVLVELKHVLRLVRQGDDECPVLPPQVQRFLQRREPMADSLIHKQQDIRRV